MEKLEYNNEPVYYCKRCLSLKILDVVNIDNSEYCDDCGATSIGKCSIEDWEKLYKNKYRHSFLNN